MLRINNKNVNLEQNKQSIINVYKKYLKQFHYTNIDKLYIQFQFWIDI